MLVEPNFADDVVKACCILHNYVRRRDGYKFEDTLSNNLEDFQNRNLGARQQGIEIREYFSEYFMNSGFSTFPISLCIALFQFCVQIYL